MDAYLSEAVMLATLVHLAAAGASLVPNARMWVFLTVGFAVGLLAGMLM